MVLSRQRGGGSDHASPPRSVRGALAGLSLCMLLPSLNISIANVALPTFADAFGVSFQAVQWVVLAYLLAITTLIVGVGRLGDMMGRGRLLSIGLLVFTGASILCTVAPSFDLLVAARAAQGIGAAVLMALTMALVGETVPQDRTGRAMGLLGAMSALGTALGPSIGGILIAGLGWRSVFLISLPLGLLAIFLVWRFLPGASLETSDETSSRARFDLLGTGLLAGALAVYALAMTLGRGHFGSVNVALLAVALTGVALFVVAESKTRSPLVRLAMLKDPVLSTGVIMSVLVMSVVMATLVVGPFYLSGRLGLDAVRIGLVMSCGPVVTALTSTLAGRLVDRLGAGTVTMIGLAALEAGALSLPRIPAWVGAPGYIGPLVIMTGGYALFQTANNTAVMRDVPKDRRGVVSGLLNLSRNLGLITGTAVMGAVFSRAAGTSAVTTAAPEVVAHAMKATFTVAAGLILVALVLAGGSRVWLARRTA